MNKILLSSIAVGLVCAFTACTGRTADNMTPTGETVEVVIPTPDIPTDSVIANGNIIYEN